MWNIHLEARLLAAMTPPSLLVNTYVKTNLKPSIDCVSKIFIIIGWFLGVNRLNVFENIHIVVLIFSLLPTVLYMCHYLFFFYSISNVFHLSLIIGTHFIQWFFVEICNLVSIRRLKRYYKELNEFDKAVGCRPRIGRVSIWNLVVTVFMLLFMMVLFILPKITADFINLFLSSMSFVLRIILEVHYYGHLLSLLIPRMRLINYYMELSLSNSRKTKNLNLEQFGYLKSDSNKTLCEMKEMMNLYHRMIRAQHYLVETVKWQLLVTLISSFLVILMGIYRLSLFLILDNAKLFYILNFLLVCGGLTFSWFSPCVLSDQVHHEVKKLRELLSARIYESQGDSLSRGMARALLAWTDKRDLSFSLLHMLDIDISLPFKFVGLLVTYLIILLQFQKIIDPNIYNDD